MSDAGEWPRSELADPPSRLRPPSAAISLEIPVAVASCDVARAQDRAVSVKDFDRVPDRERWNGFLWLNKCQLTHCDLHPS